MKFTDLNLHESIIFGLNDVQFIEPTPIQEKSIPEAIKGRDILGAAKTGSGKTGAFVIPILDQILKNPEEGIKALIISPTRELASQIDEQIFAIGYHTGLSSVTIIGGEDFGKQANAIRDGVDIIVATPGRLMDQMKVMDIDFSSLKYLVLDEADRMLDMGFLPDITHILSKLPEKRQNLLFSATMPDQIQKLIDGIMNDPLKIELEKSKTAESVSQEVYFVPNYQKILLFEHIMNTYEWNSCIVFCATKRGTDVVGKDLKKVGIEAATIHGDRDQAERNEALHKFKTGEVKVIVATDVLARGIDIDDVSLILNYDVPKSPEDYIHRIGRTGRYDKTGVAVTFVNRNDGRLFTAIEEKVGAEKIQKKHRPEEVKNFKNGKSSDSQTKHSRKTSGADQKVTDKNKQEKPKNQVKEADEKPETQPKPKSTKKPANSSKNKTDSRNKSTKPERSQQKQQYKKEPYVEIKRVDAATVRKPEKPVKHHKGFLGFIRSFFS